MSFIKDFVNRGYFYQSTNLEKLEEITNSKKIAAYIGFDCTARSLHVGNLMQIMILRLLQQHGHKPIVLVGGGTTRIGDPTGKDEMRKMLTNAQIDENIEGIVKSLSKFIKFGDGPSDAILVNNSAWILGLGYIEFLRDCGALFSVNKMLSMESAKARLDRQQSLTFLEFNYMLLQAYDFAHLSQKYGCILQLGGSDQWGNIIMGVDLAHKKLGKEVFGLTTPLLTTSSGAKMGKSVSGAIWINEDMLSPYEYFQYWRNIEDLDVKKFALLYAEWDEEFFKEFDSLIELNINEAKKVLAYRLTELCHGKNSAESAIETAKQIFEHGGIGNDVPVYYIEPQNLAKGVSAYSLIFDMSLAESKSEARKLIRGGGVKVNDEKISEDMVVTTANIKEDYIKISIGKKRLMLVKVK
jgi:tyrosyl-tRNA synthetase